MESTMQNYLTLDDAVPKTETWPPCCGCGKGLSRSYEARWALGHRKVLRYCPHCGAYTHMDGSGYPVGRYVQAERAVARVQALAQRVKELKALNDDLAQRAAALDGQLAEAKAHGATWGPPVRLEDAPVGSIVSLPWGTSVGYKATAVVLWTTPSDRTIVACSHHKFGPCVTTVSAGLHGVRVLQLPEVPK